MEDHRHLLIFFLPRVYGSDGGINRTRSLSPSAGADFDAVVPECTRRIMLNLNSRLPDLGSARRSQAQVNQQMQPSHVRLQPPQVNIQWQMTAAFTPKMVYLAFSEAQARNPLGGQENKAADMRNSFKKGRGKRRDATPSSVGSVSTAASCLESAASSFYESSATSLPSSSAVAATVAIAGSGASIGRRERNASTPKRILGGRPSSALAATCSPTPSSSSSRRNGARVPRSHPEDAATSASSTRREGDVAQATSSTSCPAAEASTIETPGSVQLSVAAKITNGRFEARCEEFMDASVQFEERSVTVRAVARDGAMRIFHSGLLPGPIIPEASSYRVAKDGEEICLTLKRANVQETWSNGQVSFSETKD